MKCPLCNRVLQDRGGGVQQCLFTIKYNEKEYNHYIVSKDHFSIYTNSFDMAYIISLQELWVKDIMYASEPSELIFNIVMDIDTACTVCSLPDDIMLKKFKLYQTFS